MQITSQQAMDFFNIQQEIADSNMPLKGAYKLHKISKQIAEFAEVFQQKFNSIVEEYAVRDENGDFDYVDEEKQQVRVNQDKIEDCNREIQALLEETIEINNQNLRVEDLGDDFECTPHEFEILAIFFTEDEDE